MATKPNEYIVKDKKTGAYVVIQNADEMSSEELSEAAAQKFAKGEYFSSGEGPLFEQERADAVEREAPASSKVDEEIPFSPSAEGSIGALGGLGLGTYRQMRGPRVQMGYGNLANLPSAGAPAGAPPMGGQPPMGSPMGGQATLGAPAPRAGGQVPPRATGPGSAVVNYGKAFGLPDIEAARALDMSKQEGGASDLLNKRREALINIRNRFPSESYVENPRFGGLMTRDQGVGGGPRASFVQSPGGLTSVPRPQYVPSAPLTPKIAPLEMMRNHFMDVAQRGRQATQLLGAAAQKLPIVSYPLAGYGMAESAKNLYDLYQMDEYGKMIPEAMVGLGTGLSLAPQTAPVGLPMLGLGVLAQKIAEASRQRKEDPEGYYRRIYEDVGEAQPILAP